MTALLNRKKASPFRLIISIILSIFCVFVFLYQVFYPFGVIRFYWIPILLGLAIFILSINKELFLQQIKNININVFYVYCLIAIFAGFGIGWFLPKKIQPFPHYAFLDIVVNEPISIYKVKINGIDVQPNALQIVSGNWTISENGNLNTTNKTASLRYQFLGLKNSDIIVYFRPDIIGGNIQLIIDGLKVTSVDTSFQDKISITIDPCIYDNLFALGLYLFDSIIIASLFLVFITILTNYRMYLLRNNTAILISIILLCYIFIFTKGISLGMDKKFLNRYPKYFAGAISRIYYHHSGYSYLCPIFYELMLVGDQTTTRDLIEFTNFDTKLTSLCNPTGDDKGGIDFATISIILFGLRIESFYYLWFLVFGLSILAFIIDNHRSPKRLLLLIFLLLSIYSTLFIIPLTKQVNSITEERLFGLLSSVAFLHIMLALFVEEKIPHTGVIILFIQAFIIILSIHVRSSAIYQVLCIEMLWVFILVYKSIKNRNDIKTRIGQVVNNRNKVFCKRINTIGRMNIPSFFIPVIIVGIIFLLFKTYQIIAYSDAISRGDITSHIFWHTVDLGLAIHPILADDYALSLDDAPVRTLINRRLNFVNVNQGWVDETKNTDIYEKMGKDVFIQIITRRPKEILELQLYYKPLVFLRTLFWLSGFEHNDLSSIYLTGQKQDIISLEERQQKDLNYRPFRLEILVIFVLCLFSLDFPDNIDGFRKEILKIVGLSSIMFLFSTIPAFISYPLLHIIIEPIVYMSLLLYVILFSLFWVIITIVIRNKRIVSVTFFL